MKLSQLKEILDKYEAQSNFHKEDPTVVVLTQGAGGPCEEITGVGMGFDWYSGKLCLGTEKRLSTVSLNKHSEVKRLYLQKISNLRKLEYQQNPPFIAKYKTKTESFEKKFEASMWLWEKLNDDLKDYD